MNSFCASHQAQPLLDMTSTPSSTITVPSWRNITRSWRALLRRCTSTIFYGHFRSLVQNPLRFLVFPKLESWFPRKQVIRKIDDLVKDFGKILEDKKQRPGNDMLTYMLEEVCQLRFMRMTIFG